MILLDTNLVSEAMKPRPDLGVQTWLDAQLAETLYLVQHYHRRTAVWPQCPAG